MLTFIDRLVQHLPEGFDKPEKTPFHCGHLGIEPQTKNLLLTRPVMI